MQYKYGNLELLVTSTTAIVCDANCTEITRANDFVDKLPEGLSAKRMHDVVAIRKNDIRERTTYDESPARQGRLEFCYGPWCYESDIKEFVRKSDKNACNCQTGGDCKVDLCCGCDFYCDVSRALLDQLPFECKS